MKRDIESLVSFLGICDRYNEVFFANVKDPQGSIFEVHKKNLLGLRDFYITSIFPFPSENLFLTFLFDKKYLQLNSDFSKDGIRIEIQQPDGKIASFITMSGSIGTGDKVNPRFLIQTVQPKGIFSEPGEYIFLITDEEGKKHNIGSFLMMYQPALPLTAERIQAIKSDPLSAKAVHFVLKCVKCGNECKIFCSLEENKKKMQEGYTWYENLPDFFVCTCKEIKVSLKIIKESMHVLLEHKVDKFSNEEIVERAYTFGGLQQVAKSFKSMIEDQKLTEEKYQKFIEKNPIILCCLAPQLLKFKSPVSAKYKTDFVVLNPQNELLLIEIEKPSTKLFKADGSQHSELTHAIDQVENWLNEGKRNRLGLLDDISMDGLNIDTLTNIKGVVIAGRKKDSESRFLEKVRSRGNIIFYTYDDLLDNLLTITRAYEKL